jgi:CheY-like chemotaxis protein
MVARRARGRLLLVEDEEQVRALAAEVLSEDGYAVEVAVDGEEALRKLHDDPSIGLLITDIRMPKLDGWALAQRAKKMLPDLRVIYMTAYAALPPDEDIGLGPVLSKPWSPSQLLRLVHQIL